MTKRQRKIRSQPDATFDKTPRRTTQTINKEINTQRYGAGYKGPSSGTTQGPSLNSGGQSKF